MLRKRILPFFLSLCLLIAACAVSVSATGITNEWGSNYETATSFTISSVEELLTFATMVNNGHDFSEKTVALTANLDLTDVDYVPVGSVDYLGTDYSDGDSAPFAGTFDGHNFTISNLLLSYGITDDDPLYDYGGLFGYVTGTVQNLHLENVSITAASECFAGVAGKLGLGGKIVNCSASGSIKGASYDKDDYGSYIGGVVGESLGTVTGCTSSCTIEDTLYSVGGIVGKAEAGSIQNCKNTGAVKGFGDVGGIVGTAENITISDCSNSGTVTGCEVNSNDNRRVGGIVGEAQATAILDCENIGDVSAEALHEVGGIAGRLYYGSSVQNCTNSGNVTGEDKTGGVVGFAEAYSSEGYEVTGCTNTGNVAGNTGVGGIAGVSTANDDLRGTSRQVISGCTNSGEISGEDNVGGIVGEHNSDRVMTSSASSVAIVSGCINTGSVSAADEKGNAGAIVGNNNDATKSSDTSSDTKPGIVQNNFWPESVGTSAVGSGAGSSDTPSPDAVRNNSAYDADGNLVGTVTDEEGNSVGTISEAVEKILGGDSLPDVLKVTAIFDCNGHGSNPPAQTVAIGTEITLPTMKNENFYTFLYWAANGQTYKAGETYTVTANTTFVAQWHNDKPYYALGGLLPTLGAQLQSPFVDVTPVDYYYDAVNWAVDNGITTGTGRLSFSPDEPCTRAQAVTFLWRAAGSPAPESTTTAFADVDANAYYAKAVAWAVENGVTNGTSDTTFSPDAPCTRAQIVSFLYRAFGSTTNAAVPFTDVAPDAYYAPAVAWAAASGVTGGTGSGRFSPAAVCTRAQIVTFLYRSCQN